MILINNANTDAAASFWVESVTRFLTEELRGGKRVRYKDRNETTTLYTTRIAKYEALYNDKCQDIIGVSEEDKEGIWIKIKRFLEDPKCLKGSRSLCDEWAVWHDTNLSNLQLKKIVGEIFVSIYDGVSNAISNYDQVANHYDGSEKENDSKTVAYRVFEILKLRTCPYCNRHYTFTLHSKKGEFKTRPEFDHFYDKSTYPMLAVTFFNLVPSCKECNHGKGTKEVGVNPYFTDFKSKFILVKTLEEGEQKVMNINEILNISKEEDFNVDFKLPQEDAIKTAEEKNMKTLGLRPLYNMHKDYVMEIVEKVAAYDVLTRGGITDRFQGLYHSETEVFNLIFGRYLSDAEQPNRPLSKLTADILTQLQIRTTP